MSRRMPTLPLSICHYINLPLNQFITISSSRSSATSFARDERRLKFASQSYASQDRLSIGTNTTRVVRIRIVNARKVRNTIVENIIYVRWGGTGTDQTPLMNSGRFRSRTSLVARD